MFCLERFDFFLCWGKSRLLFCSVLGQKRSWHGCHLFVSVLADTQAVGRIDHAFFLCNSSGILEDPMGRMESHKKESGLAIFWILCENWNTPCLSWFRGMVVAAVKKVEVCCSERVDVTRFGRPLDSLFPANAFRAVMHYRLNIWLGFYRHH